jgi:hypothetical protein
MPLQSIEPRRLYRQTAVQPRALNRGSRLSCVRFAVAWAANTGGQAA